MLQCACAGLQRGQCYQVSEGFQDDPVYAGFFGQPDQARLVLTDRRFQHD
jgi:hypothetical protein